MMMLESGLLALQLLCFGYVTWTIETGGPRLSDRDRGLFAATISIALLQLCWELWQLLAMSRLGLLSEQLTQKQTWLDFGTILGVMWASVWFLIWGTEKGPALRILVAFVASVMWMKLLSRVRLTNRHIATFVTSLFIILNGLTPFFVVTGIVMMMSIHLFRVLLSPASLMDEDGPFSSPMESFMTMFRMGLLADFEREWFDGSGASATGDAPDILFYAVMLVICILLLNVLIAVVSDKYDFAQTRSRELLVQARLEEVALFDAMGVTQIDFLPMRSLQRLRDALGCSRAGIEGDDEDEDEVNDEDEDRDELGLLGEISRLLGEERDRATQQAEATEARQQALDELLQKRSQRESQYAEAMEAKQRAVDERLDMLAASLSAARVQA